jgi:hypothetical protein
MLYRINVGLRYPVDGRKIPPFYVEAENSSEAVEITDFIIKAVQKVGGYGITQIAAEKA